MEVREQKLKKLRDDLNEQLTREHPAIDRLQRMRGSLQAAAPMPKLREGPPSPMIALPLPPGTPGLDVRVFPPPTPADVSSTTPAPLPTPTSPNRKPVPGPGPVGPPATVPIPSAVPMPTPVPAPVTPAPTPTPMPALPPLPRLDAGLFEPPTPSVVPAPASATPPAPAPTPAAAPMQAPAPTTPAPAPVTPATLPPTGAVIDQEADFLTRPVAVAIPPPPRMPESRLPMSPRDDTPPAIPPPTPRDPDSGRDRRLDELEGKLDRLMKLVERPQIGPSATGGRQDGMIVRAYDVADLVAAMKTRVIESQPGATVTSRRKVDMEPLIDLLSASVAPGTWIPSDLRAASDPERRGTTLDGRAMGTITPFFLNISLIVRHTPEVHEQFTDRLRQLRRLRDLRDGDDGLSRGAGKVDPVAAPFRTHGDPVGVPVAETVVVVTRAYDLRGIDKPYLVEKIAASIEPGTWRIGMQSPVQVGKEERVLRRGSKSLGSIKVAEGSLYVRHTHDAQHQIAALLNWLRFDTPHQFPRAAAEPGSGDPPPPISSRSPRASGN